MFGCADPPCHGGHGEQVVDPVASRLRAAARPTRNCQSACGLLSPTVSFSPVTPDSADPAGTEQQEKNDVGARPRDVAAEDPEEVALREGRLRPGRVLLPWRHGRSPDSGVNADVEDRSRTPRRRIRSKQRAVRPSSASSVTWSSDAAPVQEEGCFHGNGRRAYDRAYDVMRKELGQQLWEVDAGKIQ